MRIGLIGRADQGGLGTMTAEFARHLHPDRVLVVDLGAEGRGQVHLDRFTDYSTDVGVVTSWPHFDPKAADWLLREIDVLYTAETWYWPEIQTMAAERGIKTVLHSMPELHNGSIVADEIWVPTSWEIDRIPGARLMPVPVPLDRFPQRESREANTFLHIAAIAMKDRNGTDIVLNSIPFINAQVTLAFRGIDGNLSGAHSVATVEIWPGTEEYWDMTQGADVLVFPRRYAGLSLPMQEAMGRGMPIITTDLLPQKEWPGTLTVPVHTPRPTDMKGGVFNVWDASPNAVANAIELLASQPGVYCDLADKSRAYAESISWATMTQEYMNAFGSLA